MFASGYLKENSKGGLGHHHQRKKQMTVSSSVASLQADNVQAKLFRVAINQLFEKIAIVFAQRRLGTSFQRLKKFVSADRQREGAQILADFTSRKVLSEALIQWLKSIYQEEIIMQQSLEVTRERVNFNL